MDTPLRAFWPLTPRPDVLPSPEPRPRPTRFLGRRAPGLPRSEERPPVQTCALPISAQVDDVVGGAVHGIVEAALRQTPVNRHLPAFIAVDGHAAARLLALDTAAGRLAQPGADATTHPLPRAACARIV